ncbi:putative reverse transcriptase domain-containing protein [Tanacetum coccineum]
MIVENDMVKLVVDLKSFGMCADGVGLRRLASLMGLQPKTSGFDDNSSVSKAYGRKEMLFCDRFCDDFVTHLKASRLDVCFAVLFLLFKFNLLYGLLVYVSNSSSGTVIGFEFTDLEAVMKKVVFHVPAGKSSLVVINGFHGSYVVELLNPHTKSRGHCRYFARVKRCKSWKLSCGDELARLVPHLVTPENKRIERNGSLKKNPKKRGKGGEPRKDRNGRDDNKRTRTRNAFATTTNHVRRENTGHFAKDCRVVPRNVNPINARNPTAKTCYECGSTDHFKAACPRLNQAERPGGNHQNQVVVVNGGQGRVLGIRKS